ncbi:hypothetical protein BJ165DRAFT_1487371 [Panaeolus papilionaceus]|nr:hypothetical protein BJ165DRAFT_1487371 [Panaeolus papilionaceus]
MAKNQQTRLLIQGDVTVKSWSGKQSFYECYQSTTILATGPTGAGKSSFIEALAGRTLGISKDQLDGYTQTIAGYELVNARNQYSGPVYIIDTPGFSDSKISELEIIEMIKRWMKNHSIRYIDQVLYLCPVTDVRLPGSKRRVMEMLKSLTRAGRQLNGEGGYDNEGAVTLITTMWDMVWNDRVKERADQNYIQLKEQFWKEMVQHGSQITKFYNTQSSALEVIDISMQGPGSATETAYGLRRDRLPIRDTDHGRCLYLDLVDRIQRARQRTRFLRLDLSQPETLADNDLVAILGSQLDEAEQMQVEFERQLVEFGPPPLGLESAILTLEPIPIDSTPSQASSEDSSIASPTDPQTNSTKSPPSTPPKALKYDAEISDPIGSPPNSPDTSDQSRKKRSASLRPFEVGLKGMRRKGRVIMRHSTIPFKSK